MIEVISVKFKNRGKSYFFSPNGTSIRFGDQVIVETSKGLELADCCHGNHMVEDSSVVQPLRPVIRVATAEDIRIAENNRKREKEAFDVCQQKIAEHGLDMKLVDVECNFEGSKTLFFFTSDGRVDFRELVKDLAGVFRNRIELRQIGVRDEAKMLGGLGICGRPFCCSRFLDDFQPVSTKMAKMQSMSLNPSKISGTCGRLMCCLRYEQEAYEDLVKSVPKQGAFVETPAGYGNVTQINLLRQLVKVKLDGDGDDTVRTYKAEEVAAVPGGRPKDGETPPSVLKLAPVKEPFVEEHESEWQLPAVFAEEEPEEQPKSEERKKPEREHKNNRRRNNRPAADPAEKRSQPGQKAELKPEAKPKPEPKQKPEGDGKATVKAKPKTHQKNQKNSAAPAQNAQPKEKKAAPQSPQHTTGQSKENGEKAAGAKRRNYYHRGRPKQKKEQGSAN